VNLSPRFFPGVHDLKITSSCKFLLHQKIHLFTSVLLALNDD
jgi:hypothetical protein